MDVCNAKNRIGNYAPTSGTSGGSGTWTITSTETSNVAQSIMYINAVDIQANHGSFTTLTLNGVDFSGSVTDANTKTQFMTVTTSPNLTTFSSAISAPSITLTGGVLTLTTITSTNANIGTLTATTKITTPSLELATNPTYTYTSIPSLTSSQLGYVSSTYTISNFTVGTTATTALTLPISLPLGVWMVTFYIRYQGVTTTTASTATNIQANLITGTSTNQGSYFKTIPALGTNTSLFDTISGTSVINQSNPTAQACLVQVLLTTAITGGAVSVNTSSSSNKLSALVAVRIA